MDDRASPDEALQFNNTFSDAAATAPRRRPAEQTGFGSGVAASAPRHNDSDQLGSRSRFDSGVAASAPRHSSSPRCPTEKPFVTPELRRVPLLWLVFEDKITPLLCVIQRGGGGVV